MNIKDKRDTTISNVKKLLCYLQMQSFGKWHSLYMRGSQQLWRCLSEVRNLILCCHPQNLHNTNPIVRTRSSQTYLVKYSIKIRKIPLINQSHTKEKRLIGVTLHRRLKVKIQCTWPNRIFTFNLLCMSRECGSQIMWISSIWVVAIFKALVCHESIACHFQLPQVYTTGNSSDRCSLNNAAILFNTKS